VAGAPVTLFVAGAAWGAAAGYWLGRRPYSGRAAPAPAGRPLSPARPPGHVSPTHPAARRPALYDWDKDGAA
jgi:hypothetical protein